MRIGRLNNWMHTFMNGEPGAAGGAPTPPEPTPPTGSFTQADIDKALAAQQTEFDSTLATKVEEGKAGLLKKNGDLLTELKGYRAADDKLKELEMVKNGDLDGLKKSEQERMKALYEPQIKELKDGLEKYKNTIYDSVKTSTLEREYSRLNVQSSLREDLSAVLAAQHDLQINDDHTAMTIDGLPANEFFETWSKSEKAKFYIVGQTSVGGGSGGAGGKVNQGYKPQGGAAGVSAAIAARNNK